MLGLNLNHVSKRGPRWTVRTTTGWFVTRWMTLRTITRHRSSRATWTATKRRTLRTSSFLLFTTSWPPAAPLSTKGPEVPVFFIPLCSPGLNHFHQVLKSLPHMVVDGFIVMWRAAEVGCQVLVLVGDLTTSSCSTCAQTSTLFDHGDVTRGSILQVKCAIAFDLTGRCEWCYLRPLLLTWFNCIPIMDK